MRSLRHLLPLLAGMAILACPAMATRADEAGQPPKDLVLKGDARCTSCHEETDSPNVLRIGKSRHGTRADARTPTCTNCHGQSDAHEKEANAGARKPAKPDVTFKKGSLTPVALRNEACMDCHQTDAERMHWKGSAHEGRDVACASCHQVHTDHDAVRDKRTQPEVCFACHKDQRANANKPSHHPVAEGRMTCSDCHNPHGTLGEKLLAKDTVNDTCYQCHAEKRGPLLWPHQPVEDDCTNCHNPHGTAADSMLKVRVPFLCLQCHDPSSHLGNVPGVIANIPNINKNAAGNNIGAGTTPADNWNTNTAVGKTQGLSCMNCHPEVHGSNNPVGNSTNAKHFWR